MTQNEWKVINDLLSNIAYELKRLEDFCEENKVPFEPPYTVVSDIPLTNDND